MTIERREVLGVLAAAVGSALLPGSFAVAEQNAAAPASEKEAVSGIGGFFFRARDPKVLAQWYQDHLGIFVTPRKPEDPVWQQQGFDKLYAVRRKDELLRPYKQWMLNFRVVNLDRLVGQLTEAGITVKVDPTAYPYGRFAHLQDPEGNPIELWQPMKVAKRNKICFCA